MKKVLVIVVTYNGMKWLDRCLGSVAGDGLSESAMTVDVFVVDNDSTDGSADYIQGHFPQAKLIRCAENLGFSKANNLGFEYALKKGYDYVYLLNQDAWLEAGALETLVSAADSHPEYAVLSPLQYQDGYKELDRQFAKKASASLSGTSGHPRPDKREGPAGEASGRGREATVQESDADAEPIRLPFVMAAHWLVPTAAIRKIGLFNEELFPLYGQDDDWCNRARYHGFTVGVVPEARAVHDRAQRKEAKEKIIDRNYRVGSLVRLCDINRPLWERFLFVCLFTLVKTAKYVSFLPLKHFISICKALPSVRKCRRHAI
ncbi:MAG: glycosyltransferase family 2 protein [Bacteroidales bacterium]|nr:glycosyltransferase family 2 protein [Bacteroidales bacterium]